jgi:hypothetical protein
MRLPNFTALASIDSNANQYIGASAQSGGAARGVIMTQFSLCPPGLGPVACCLEGGGRMECREQQGHIHCECVPGHGVF